MSGLIRIPPGVIKLFPSLPGFPPKLNEQPLRLILIETPNMLGFNTVALSKASGSAIPRRLVEPLPWTYTRLPPDTTEEEEIQPEPLDPLENPSLAWYNLKTKSDGGRTPTHRADKINRTMATLGIVPPWVERAVNAYHILREDTPVDKNLADLLGKLVKDTNDDIFRRAESFHKWKKRDWKTR